MLYLGARRALLSSANIWTPRLLFAPGDLGAWYDPSDLLTLFQDSAGTTPVTAVGQPVGKMLDKSGCGNHATQPTEINCPVLQQDASGRCYLAFNGINSWMSTAAIDFTVTGGVTDKLSIISGIAQNSGVTSIVFEFSENVNLNTGTFYLSSSEASAGDLSFRNRGNGPLQLGGTSSGTATPVKRVVSQSLNIAETTIATEIVVRINQVPLTLINYTTTTDSGTGNYGNHPLYIGARGGSSFFFNGNIYGLVICGATSTDAQINAAEKFLNQKTGAY